jgi:tetratricopeptide (TPR) repeat protein
MQASHILKVPLAQTVALSYAKRNDLASSGKVLKRHLEPAIEATKNPKLLAEHYLQVARLLYQAGNLDAAEAYYEKVPNNVPEYLAAREELTWVWLRQGNMPKLRGEIATLNSGLFDKAFAPEVPLVRAVSNLKLCYYDAVEGDIQKFVQTNAKWAKEIEEALKSEDPQSPPKKDYFTAVAETSLQKKQAEMNEVNKLLEDSVQAVIPAVGPQSHWVVARDQLNKKLELAKQSKSEEYRRQWKNMQHALTEGIRKMQFVKVELLTQVKLYGGSTTTLTQKALKVEDVKELNDPQNMTFKFDGVVWPDELFQMRGIAQAKCLGMK